MSYQNRPCWNMYKAIRVNPSFALSSSFPYPEASYYLTHSNGNIKSDLPVLLYQHRFTSTFTEPHLGWEITQLVQGDHVKFAGLGQTLALHRSWNKGKGWICSLLVSGIARICSSASLSSFVEMVTPNIPPGAKVWWRARRKAVWGVFVGPKGTSVRFQREFQWFAVFERITEIIKLEIINSQLIQHFDHVSWGRGREMTAGGTKSCKLPWVFTAQKIFYYFPSCFKSIIGSAKGSGTTQWGTCK